MAPPVTPSPYRFLARSDQSIALSATKPRPAGTHANPPLSQARTPAPQDAVTPSQQFKPTPRFSVPASRPGRSAPFPPTPRESRPDGFASPLYHNSRPLSNAVTGDSARGKRTLKRVDSIEQTSQELVEAPDGQDGGDSMLFDALVGQGMSSPVETVGAEGRRRSVGPEMVTNTSRLSEAMHEFTTWGAEQPVKRRRLSPTASNATSFADDQSLSKHHYEQTGTKLEETAPQGRRYGDQGTEAARPIGFESPPRSTKPPRFRVPGQTPAAIVETEPSPTQYMPSRPRNPFLLPPTARSGVRGSDSNLAEGITPLPEHFSPHRRSQKFVPGGMADVVRNWVLSVGHGGFQALASSQLPGQGPSQMQRTKQPSKIKVAGPIDERCGDRMKLVTGQMIVPSHWSNVDGGEPSLATRAVLVGSVKGASRDLKNGDVVGIAPPSWEVNVGPRGEKWLVAVDWNVT